ncbi:MAG: hypothetical protein HOE69_07440 [Euryarchaeota archaeon]|nr:hypothetical protein [Euryarchaeota archaeon]MBT6645806.1 hypothetical protein [Euryarchaeota archaeon]
MAKDSKLPSKPMKKRGRLRKIFAFIPWAVRGGYKVAKKLPKEKRQELIAVAKDPDAWGEAIAKGWDVAKIEAIEAKDAFGTLGKIALGRKTSRAERKKAAEQLGLVGFVVTPLRVFLIPGSEILLSVVAFVIPWRLVPDKWIPFQSLRDNPDEEISKQKRKRLKLFRKDRQRIIDKLD